MLVLSRKLGQRFQIGPDVRITVVKLDKNSVRIGIEAPDDMAIYREEVTPREADAPADPKPFAAATRER